MAGWEDRSVRIDCTCNALDIESGREIRRLSRAQNPNGSREGVECVPFRLQENHRSQSFRKPYRKPTPVGWSSRPRRTDHLVLRSSAMKRP